MDRRMKMLGVSLAAAIAMIAGASGITQAHGQQWPGWGMMGQGSGWCPMMGQGMGPGMMMGYGMGPGMMGQGMGPGMMGYGMGPGMMGQGMMGQGMGPGMMGYGAGPGMMSQGAGTGMMGGGPAAASLSIDDVKSNIDRWLSWQGNPRLKAGKVAEKDKYTITAEIVTVDDSLVQKLEVDRRTGMMWPVRE
jgi:hypothetical protein